MRSPSKPHYSLAPSGGERAGLSSVVLLTKEEVRGSFFRARPKAGDGNRTAPNLQLSTCNLQPATCNLQPATCNLQPATCNLQPATPCLLLCLVLATLTGCAGYTLGPSNGLAAREKSIQIAPFSNQTLEPRLTDAVTAQLRKQLQRDGTYQLATHDNGDLLLSGVITGFQRREMSFLRNDTLTVRDYRLSLTAQVTARDRASGKLILDQRVSGYTIIRVGSDLASTERQALPLLAADLAKNVTALLVDGSW